MDKASGAVKDAVGKVTDNDKLRAEGAIDKAKGQAREVIGDVKDGMKKADVDAQRDREASETPNLSRDSKARGRLSAPGLLRLRNLGRVTAFSYDRRRCAIAPNQDR
jgi:uncharacterized protein YjbJ (UPF0337 family)